MGFLVRLLLVLSLIVPSYVAAQSPLTTLGVGVGKVSGFTPSCTESGNFLTRATTVTSDTDKQNYDTLICGIVSDGDWTGIDILYIWAAPDTTAALLNLRQNAFNGTTGGTPTAFTAYRGYTGASASFSINTGYTMSTGGGSCTLNSCMAGAYVLTSRTTDQTWDAVGYANGGGQPVIRLEPQAATNVILWGMNVANAAGLTSTSNSNSQGSWLISRRASNDQELYLNSASFVANSASTTGSLPANNLFFFAYSATNGRTADEMSAGIFGGGVSDTAACRIMNRINTYMTAYSINLYSNPAC